MPTTDMMIDALIRFRQNPEGAPLDQFWVLVERFRADLVNQAYALLGNLQDAEDVAQESLCRAHRDLHRLEDPFKIGAWIRAINRCNALDLLRRRKLEKKAKHTLQDQSEESVTGGYDRVAVHEVVARVVDSLPDELRTVVVFRYWERLAYQDIAAKLGIPLGTVKSQLSRADRIMEKRLVSVMNQGRPAPAKAVAAGVAEDDEEGARE